jgi:hypothetical protein
MLQCFFVRNGKSLSAFSSAGGQHSAAIGASHSLTESVLVFSLSFGRLKGTFHDKYELTLKLRAAKMIRINWIYKINRIKIPLAGEN